MYNTMDLRLIEVSKPIKFYQYPHYVEDRIAAWIPINTDDYLSHQNNLLNLFRHHGIQACRDNKTAFEVELKGQRFFIGFFDWCMSIGLSVVKW
jgi:hypothetical protein